MISRAKLIRCAALLPVLPVVPVARAQTDPAALLAESDAIRNPSQPYRVTVTLTEFEKGQQVDSSVLTAFARISEATGQFVTLLRFVQPARDAGKLLLKAGNDLWFYDPGTKASVRISPQQRLLGQAANGDVVTVNFARDYKSELVAEETTQDGERRQRKAHKLRLTATGDDATYAAADLWLDADNRQPLKARFYAESGRLLKTAYYRRFEPQLGATRPTETVIIDGVNTASVTIVRFTEYAARNLPTAWFQRDFLSRFQGD